MDGWRCQTRFLFCLIGPLDWTLDDSDKKVGYLLIGVVCVENLTAYRYIVTLQGNFTESIIVCSWRSLDDACICSNFMRVSQEGVKQGC